MRRAKPHFTLHDVSSPPPDGSATEPPAARHSRPRHRPKQPTHTQVRVETVDARRFQRDADLGARHWTEISEIMRKQTPAKLDDVDHSRRLMIEMRGRLNTLNRMFNTPKRP